MEEAVAAAVGYCGDSRCGLWPRRYGCSGWYVGQPKRGGDGGEGRGSLAAVVECVLSPSVHQAGKLLLLVKRKLCCKLVQ